MIAAMTPKPPAISDTQLDYVADLYADTPLIRALLAELRGYRDRDLWWPTAVSTLLQICHSPEVEACLTERQLAALKRVDEGYDG